jgi:Mn-containing catalase
MFYHLKELQFNARVFKPDPRLARILLEQFGGANGELKAAMQYFTQVFSCRQPDPDKYDMLMDIATEEFSHLEIAAFIFAINNQAEKEPSFDLLGCGVLGGGSCVSLTLAGAE